jgi:hypothetical protein
VLWIEAWSLLRQQANGGRILLCGTIHLSLSGCWLWYWERRQGYGIGASAQLDGNIYPDQVKQLQILGGWYRPRKNLFTDSYPLRYSCEQVPGIKIHPSSVKSIASINNRDIIVHLINMEGITENINVEFKGRRWENISRIFIEPSGKELKMENTIKS